MRDLSGNFSVSSSIQAGIRGLLPLRLEVPMRSARLLGISVAGGAVLIISAHLLAARVPASEPPDQRPADSAVAGVFEGRTPCGQVATDFTGYPAATCEKIKWEITLYRDRASGKPAGYQYRGTRTTEEVRGRSNAAPRMTRMRPSTSCITRTIVACLSCPWAKTCCYCWMMVCMFSPAMPAGVIRSIEGSELRL